MVPLFFGFAAVLFLACFGGLFATVLALATDFDQATIVIYFFPSFLLLGMGGIFVYFAHATTLLQRLPDDIATRLQRGVESSARVQTSDTGNVRSAAIQGNDASKGIVAVLGGLGGISGLGAIPTAVFGLATGSMGLNIVGLLLLVVAAASLSGSAIVHFRAGASSQFAGRLQHVEQLARALKKANSRTSRATTSSQRKRKQKAR